MKPRFSFAACCLTMVSYIGAWALLAIVPDIVWPEHEFDNYWLGTWRDTLEGLLFSPGLLVFNLWPRHFVEAHRILAVLLASLFCLVAWGAVGGLLWPWLRFAVPPETESHPPDSPA